MRHWHSNRRMLTSLLVEELAVAAVGPRVVVSGEVGAVFYAGVVVEPELGEGGGVGVFEPGFAESLEAGYGGLLRIGDEAVNGFLAVDVGLVLEVAAEGIGRGGEDEAGERNREDKNHEAGARGECVGG